MSTLDLRSGFVVTAFAAIVGCFGCGGSVVTSSGADGSMEGSGQTGGSGPMQDDSGSGVCTAANPCPAGDAGCPIGLLPYPSDGDPCAQPGLGCYGYGSRSCPLMLTCLANGTWQVSCPEHPFGTDSGSCGCSHVIPSGGGSSSGGSAAQGGSSGGSSGGTGAGGNAVDAQGSGCSSGVPIGCSCPTTYDGGTCVCSCFSMPECPEEVLTSQPLPCNHAPSCMNCIGGVAGVTCGCIDSGDAGSHWQCLGTEQSCTGGTFHG